MATVEKLSRIKNAIKRHLHPLDPDFEDQVNYTLWYCGIANEEQIRILRIHNKELIFSLFFKCWDAKCKESALAIAEHFHSVWMGGANQMGGASPDARFVYVFKINPHLFKEIKAVLE